MANQTYRDQVLADLARRAGRGAGSWATAPAGSEQPTQGAATQQPAMSAGEVQQLLTTPEGAPQVAGIGQTGTGAWRSAMTPGLAGIDYGAVAAGNPGAYQSAYAPAMQQTLNQLLARQPFTYDVNADGLYQQIKDNYIKAGKQAMMDTQGQSAALTGGYGNSYGAGAGQQAYQESLGNLANAIPTLAQQAYAQYMDQGDQLRNNLEAMRLLEGQDYSRWLEDQQAYQEFLQTMPALAAAGRGGGGYNGPQVIFAGGHPGAAGAGTGSGVAGLNPELVGGLLGWQQQGANLQGFYGSAIGPYSAQEVGAALDALGFTNPSDVVDTVSGAAPVYWGNSGSGGSTGTGTGTGGSTGTGGNKKKRPGTPFSTIQGFVNTQ